jgi:hypothetical protein
MIGAEPIALSRPARAAFLFLAPRDRVEIDKRVNFFEKQKRLNEQETQSR